MHYMTTTTIQIKPHLAQYIIGKYGNGPDRPVRFPESIDLYHTIWDLMAKRPLDQPVDSGNLEIVLPDRRVGKNPEHYNYLCERSQVIIQRKIETAFFAELHDLLDEQKHRYCVEYIDTVHYFKMKYSIDSLTDDALLKNYYRWRETHRRKKEKRSYTKK